MCNQSVLCGVYIHWSNCDLNYRCHLKSLFHIKIKVSKYILPIFCFQFSSVPQSCPTLCDPMNRSTPGLPVHHQLLEFTQTHVHWVSGAIQPSHPLSSPFPPTPNPSQHQRFFQWVNSLHEVYKSINFSRYKEYIIS